MDVPGVPETWDMIMERAMEKKVMLLPGQSSVCPACCSSHSDNVHLVASGKAFSPDKSVPCSRLRAAFSLASEEKMDEAFRRLAELIREEKQRNGSK